VGDDVTRTRQIAAVAAANRRAFLEVVAGDAPRRISIDRDAIVVGRSRDVDLQLDVDGVSRRHARIVRSGGQALSLVDLGAKNGTFLNGERVDIAALHHGDRIQVGPVVLVFSLLEVGEVSASAAATTATSSVGSVRASLSAREWEVAMHVARGLTNPDVAKALGIGRRTVATHLERIYERLGIHSRAALANLVAHDGSGDAGGG
jgi:pSer/pThr/pTyr-binding forkhead associated (FHA) protein